MSGGVFIRHVQVWIQARGKARSSFSRKKASRNPAAQQSSDATASPTLSYRMGTITSVEAATMPKIPWKVTA